MFCWKNKAGESKKSKKDKPKIRVKKLSRLVASCELNQSLLATTSEDKESVSSKSSGFLLFPNRDDGGDPEDWHFSSVWGKDIKDWDGHLSQTSPISSSSGFDSRSSQNLDDNDHRDDFVDFSPETLLKFSSDQDHHKSTDTFTIEHHDNFEDGSQKSVNTSDTGLCSDSDQYGITPATSRNHTPNENRTHSDEELCSSDRNRLGPLGKASSVDGTGPATTAGSSALNGRYTGNRLAYDGLQMPVKNSRSHSVNTVSIPTVGSGTRDRLIDPSHQGPASSMHTNNNQMVHRNLHTNNSHNQNHNALISENTLLKEQLHQLGHRVYELQEQLDNLAPIPEQLKFHVEQLKHSNAGFESMSVVAQYLDLQNKAIVEKLKQVQEGIQTKEQDLATARLKEVQALRLEFGRERECTKEELNSLMKKHEFEMREQACNFEDNFSELKDHHVEDLEDLKRKHRQEMEQLDAAYRLNLDAMKRKHKEQMISYTKQTPCEVLHKEINSLEVVIEIRNQEIKDLRRELLVYKELAENLSDVKDQNHALLAKVEDLEAQLEKTRGDKSSLLGKYQSMEESMTLVVTENDRLHLYNEELHWRIESLKSSTDSTLSTPGQNSMSKSSMELGSNSPFSDAD